MGDVMGRRLTADLVACAVVGAARSYGDDPVEAMTAQSGMMKRSLAPAIEGLARATGVTRRRAAAVLGVMEVSLSRAKARGGERYGAAVAAAEAAVRAGPMAVADTEPRALPPAIREPAPVFAHRSRRIVAPRVVRAEVLAALASGQKTGPELMAALGVGEGAIRAALSGLKDDGAVVSTAATAEGWGAQFWRLGA